MHIARCLQVAARRHQRRHDQVPFARRIVERRLFSELRSKGGAHGVSAGGGGEKTQFLNQERVVLNLTVRLKRMKQ